MILPGPKMPMIMVKRGFDPNTPLGTFIEGGYYLGNILDGDLFALIIAPKSGGETSGLQWKTTLTATAGTGSLTNGVANTDVMDNALHPIGQWARGLSINGFNDWSIPARTEFMTMISNKSYLDGSQAFHSSNWYWTSTQNSVERAWIVQPAFEQMTFSDKNDIFNWSRAYRRVLISS